MLDSIIKLVGYNSFYKGRDYIYHQNMIKENGFKYIESENSYFSSFDVESMNTRNKYYKVIIKHNGEKINGYECNCPAFKNNKTCKHVAAVLYCCDELLMSRKYVDKFTITNEILDEFEVIEDSKNQLKRKINYKVEIIINHDSASFKLSLGDEKLYVVTNSKLSSFLSAYKNDETFEFGKNFIYDPNKYYFDNEGQKIMDFLLNSGNNNSYYSYYDQITPFSLSYRELEYLFNILGNKNINILNYGIVNEIKRGMPTKYILSKDDNYKLVIEDYENYKIINDNFIIYNKDLYILNDKETKLIRLLSMYNISSLEFKDNQKETFRNKIFKNIKNNIIIDENIEDFKVSIKPTINLYFSLSNVFKCNVIFKYGEKEINYFDNVTDERDLNYENDIIEKLINDGFINDNSSLFIDDSDIYYNFVENRLDYYINNYNTFLDKKTSDTSFKKNLSTTNNFSLGKDNILSYTFKVDGIDNDELSNIFKALKEKKKYYKLKDSSVLKLDENANIEELGEIIEDLDLTNNDLKDGLVTIPKYRALYIDSLKEKSNISTNNVFDDFINNFKKYKNTKVNFSDYEEELLRDYQKDGVKWLTTIYKCDLGGILADEMGLGKTLQAITLINHIIKENKSAKILIVSPTSLVYNWQKEFMKFAPDLKFVSIQDIPSKRKIIFDNIDNYNVLITSYGLIRNDTEEFKKISFDLCIIDEAQNIKNYKTGISKEIKNVNAKCKLALTGTPIENNVVELWNIFDYIMPGYLNNVMNFNKKYNVKDLSEDSKKILSDLKKKISPFILRRKKKDVLSDLPDKIENNIYIELPDTQKKLYLSKVEETKKEMEDMININGYDKSKILILSLLTKLREICIDPSVIYENYEGESVKIDELIRIVNENILNGHKILIFSSFKRVLENVQKKFKENSITSYLLTGETKPKDRALMVESFNDDSTNCFLISLKAGGTGLNLTSADIVIHLDIWWNPQVENQATDRAHRIGQKNNVTVLRLITKGTIEEKIIELQEKKRELSNSLIENNKDAVLISKLTEKDIKNLLKD